MVSLLRHVSVAIRSDSTYQSTRVSGEPLVHSLSTTLCPCCRRQAKRSSLRTHNSPTRPRTGLKLVRRARRVPVRTATAWQDPFICPNDTKQDDGVAGCSPGRSALRPRLLHSVRDPTGETPGMFPLSAVWPTVGQVEVRTEGPRRSSERLISWWLARFTHRVEGSPNTAYSGIILFAN